MVVRFPAGPRVSLKTVDLPKGNGLGQKKKEEFRKVMKVEIYAWLCMESRYRAKHWLHGLTAEPFQKFTEYILGDRVFGIQIPISSSDTTGQQKVKPDWSIVPHIDVWGFCF